jgi:hypothetical protein
LGLDSGTLMGRTAKRPLPASLHIRKQKAVLQMANLPPKTEHGSICLESSEKSIFANKY